MDKLTIGWIGTGVMGLHMCGHLMSKGDYWVLVYNRTESKCLPLIEKGAMFASIEDIGKQADFVFMMVGYPKDVEEVVFGENGLSHHMKVGSILIDHTTSSPDLAEWIASELAAKGIGSIDAPVSGGDIGAKNG